MSSITNCPECLTQFIVTEEQINQHNGKVRCGHCLHVFDAKAQLLDSNELTINDLSFIQSTFEHQPQNNDDLINEDKTRFIKDETSFSGTVETTTDYAGIINNNSNNLNEVVIQNVTAEAQSNFFIDQADKSRLLPLYAIERNKSWLWALFAFVLLLVAVIQCIYFLRTEISIYYPKVKPYLEQACEKLACSIELPKKIELIIIDDSDIQEVANYAGLMNFTSTLINQAEFNQAYPNLELTLTDVEDKPVLRRIFKPEEYLPENKKVINGLAPGEEIKLKLALTTKGVIVAGYRVFLSY